MPYYSPDEYPDIHSDFPQPLRWFRATRYGRWNERVFVRLTDAIRPFVEAVLPRRFH